MANEEEPRTARNSLSETEPQRKNVTSISGNEVAGGRSSGTIWGGYSEKVGGKKLLAAHARPTAPSESAPIRAQLRTFIILFPLLSISISVHIIQDIKLLEKRNIQL